MLTALLAMQRQSWEQGVAGPALLDLGLDELAVLIADGWLAPSWLDVGADLLAAADRRVDRYGRVTGVSGAPEFAGPGTSPEAQAFHLLAHAALDRARAAVNPAR
ncbi:hypothetical protein EV384_2973 [Micromonospora kangleipakensis]|uniref:Uncharacterized protein n=1 Tax=Micromonospora kangleipakensis TaxID=1077942 RepID=A0A4Q8BBM6_9ACTN|nr:hypothetical protein [Micromonospora kangleipakensis]RZU74503.1 hypothetical protein EV384_2973 [Micromonospora kangleipakensis]